MQLVSISHSTPFFVVQTAREPVAQETAELNAQDIANRDA